MPPSKTVQITLGGEQRTLAYRFAAFRALGLAGPLDGDGWDKALNEAGNDFDKCAEFVLAGLLHEKRSDTKEGVLEGMADWDIDEFLELVKNSSLAVFGSLIPETSSAPAPEGSGDGRPPEAQTGSQPGPLPATTTDSPIPISGA